MAALPGRMHLPEIQRFFRDFEGKDAADVALRLNPIEGVPVSELSRQLAARNKAKTKLPAWYANKEVIFPDNEYLQQSSSEITARYKSTLIQGDTLIDLTGGSGVDCFYLSRSFKNTIFVEPDEALFNLAKYNFDKLRKPEIHILNLTAAEYISKYDLDQTNLYIDPSRRDLNGKKVFRFADCTPDITLLIPKIRSRIKSVLIKASPMIDISQALEEIAFPVEQIFVVAVQNECKEVLFLLREKASFPLISAIDLAQGITYSFTVAEEKVCIIEYGPVKLFLYEPNVAIIKAGALKLIAKKFGLIKLHVNTHLYTSDKLVSDFPGKIFQVHKIGAYKPRHIRNSFTQNKANITIRNFPVSVNTIRRNTGLTPGGNQYLYAYTAYDGQKQVAFCSRLAENEIE